MINKKKLKYYESLDEEVKKKNRKVFRKTGRTIVSLTSDNPFKAFFSRNPDFLKEFLILELNLDLDPDDTFIEVFSEELPPENLNGRVYRVDVMVYLDDNIVANTPANKKKYDYMLYRNLIYMAKLTSMTLIKKGQKLDTLKNKKLFQLNINANEYDKSFGEDILELKGKHIKADKFSVFIKNIAYYRKLYYNKVKLTKAELWLVVLSSKTYTELYKILCDTYDDESHIDEIMEEVFKLNHDMKILTDWEAQILDDLVNLNEREGEAKIAEEKGKEEANRETAKKMLEKNMDLETISEITGLSRDEIENL